MTIDPSPAHAGSGPLGRHKTPENPGNSGHGAQHDQHSNLRGDLISVLRDALGANANAQRGDLHLHFHGPVTINGPATKGSKKSPANDDGTDVT